MAEKETENKGAETTAPTPSQGEGTQATDQLKLVDHVVTESDLKHNPELAEKGVKVGDKVQIPAEAKAKADARELKAKEDADKKAKAESDAKAKDNKKSKKYTVISPFADRDNFGKKWEEGDDVSHFTQDRLDLCVERGLVKKG